MIFTASDVSSLATSLEHWEWAEYASCALVALGCTGEYIAEFTDCCTGGLKEKKDRLARRSTLLLISALALELMCLVKTNSISTLLIGSLSEKASAADTKAQSAIQKSSSADDKANEAGKSAGEAQRKADAVAKQSYALTTRMESASRKLGDLERDILAQGPRWRALKNAETTFTKALKPFAGQRVIMVSCGPSDTERFDLENSLQDLFVKAEWNAPGVAPWAGCSNMLTGGNRIYFAENAEERVKTAAKALYGALNKLNISTMEMAAIAAPQGITAARVLFGEESPYEMAVKDPTTIFLLIGPNALWGRPGANERKKPHNNTPAK
jgi:hypothetical protein